MSKYNENQPVSDTAAPETLAENRHVAGDVTAVLSPPINIGSDFNNGFSWGLEYPMIYGERPSIFDGFLVWDRHTGEVAASFPHKRNVHGYSLAETDARRF